MSAPDLLHLTKLHGLGNDFLVHLAEPTDPAGVAALTGDRSELAGRVLRTPPRGRRGRPAHRRARRAPDRWTMTLHNADGSRAEMSGNGIRCFAQAVTRRLGPDGPTELHIATDAGERVVTVSATTTPRSSSPRSTWARCRRAGHASRRSPRPSARPPGRHVRPRQPPPRAPRRRPGDVDVAAEGPEWEALFPDGINVHFVLADGDDRSPRSPGNGSRGHRGLRHRRRAPRLRPRTAGALVGDDVTVTMPGGSVQVQLDDRVTLTGPSEWIADLTVPA